MTYSSASGGLSTKQVRRGSPRRYRFSARLLNLLLRDVVLSPTGGGNRPQKLLLHKLTAPHRDPVGCPAHGHHHNAVDQLHRHHEHCRQRTGHASSSPLHNLLSVTA